MAIYNLRVTPANGRSAVYRYNYTLRIDNFSWDKNEKYNDFLYAENMNMPSFAKEDPKEFWEACEELERSNANTFRTIDFSLPTELSDEENIELASNFAKEIFKNNYAYSLAIHSKKSNKDGVNNIHCHLMFSERELDGIERSKTQFFKRYNSENPELGGCRKNQTWTAFSKLYYIRQTWEELANEKLKEKDLELISSKSLEDQRVDSLVEENYLKAELLDRPAVHIEKKYIDFAADTPEKEKAIEFFNYAKEIKDLKEKEFKLKSENFEEENQKAKEKFLKKFLGEENYSSLNFDTTEKQKENQEEQPAEQKEESQIEKQVEEQFNFENIFLESIENNILIDKKENRLKQLNSITEEDVQSRAFNIVSKGEYPKKVARLKEIDELYDSLVDKNNFKYTTEKAELEASIEAYKNDEDFINKTTAMIFKINSQMEEEKAELTNDLQFLRENNFRDLHLENTLENKVRTQEFYKKTTEYISDLKVEKEKIDKEVKEYKSYLERDIKYDIYFSIKEEAAEKYKELLSWKKEFEEYNSSLEDKIELSKRIKARELGFKKFNIENNIKEKFDLELKTRREHYKELRQTQDDVKGKLSYSFAMIKELKKIKMYDLIERENILSEDFKLLEGANKLDKLQYNMKVAILKEDHSKLSKDNINLNEFKLNLSNEERLKYQPIVVEKIKELQTQLEDLKGQLVDKELTTEDLKTRILDKETKGNYSKCKLDIAYYKKQIEKGLSVPENYAMLKISLSEIKELEKGYKISSEQIQAEQQIINEKNIKVVAKIESVKSELKVNYKTLKGLKLKPKLMNIRPKKQKDNFSKKLRVAQSGRIEIKEETKEREKLERWENEL